MKVRTSIFEKASLTLPLLAVFLMGGTAVHAAGADMPPAGAPCYGASSYGPMGPGMMGYSGCGGPGAMYGAPARQLSDADREKFDSVMQKYGAKLDDLRDRMFVRNAELDALRSSRNTDVAAVTKAAEDLVKMRGEERSLIADMQAELKKLGF